MKTDLSGVILETERLRLRPWRESDLEAFFAYASVPGVGEMAGWPHHTDIEATKAILASFIENKNVFAVADRETDAAIGSLGIHHSWANEDERFKDKNIVEIGYVLSKAHWGKGLMPEAVKAVLPYLFDTLHVDGVTVCHFKENRQSRRVIEKCGFTHMQSGVNHSKQLQRDIEDEQYLMLRPE